MRAYGGVELGATHPAGILHTAVGKQQPVNQVAGLLPVNRGAMGLFDGRGSTDEASSFVCGAGR